MANPYKKEWPRLLKYGDSGDAVKWLQSRLLEQGMFKGSVKGNFRSITQNAVRYFQSTHVDQWGNPLVVDGEVGTDTLYALRNPSGEAQASDLPDDNIIPSGLSADRRKFLQVVAKDYRSGNFIEDPDGSNWGPRLSQFLPGHYPWCAFYQSYAYNRAFDKWPLGKNHGHVLTFWREAMEAGFAFKKDKHKPLPGDMGVMLYRNNSGNLTGSGHIFAVTRVSANGQTINTIGGNEGNRLKHGIRDVGQATIEGWIGLYGDDRDKIWNSVEKGIIERPGAATTTSGTR